MRDLRPLSILLVLTLAAPLAAAKDGPTTVREGKHFRVVAHFESKAAADQMLATVEALWPHAATLYGLPQGKLETLLEVHLYRDPAGYEVAMEKHAGGKFKRNLAAALWESRTAHVAVQPNVSDEVLSAVGLPYLTRNLLLHEASHLVRFHALANYRSHPDWLADGAAQWLKFEALRSLGLIDGIEADPTSGKGIARAQQKGAVKVETILDDKVEDGNWYTVYAVKRLFFTHLMTAHAETMISLMQGIKSMGVGSDFKARAKDAFVRALGESEMANLDAAFEKYLGGLKPAWSEPYRSLEAVGDDWVQIAFPKTNAVAWRTQPVKKTRYAFSAQVHILRNYGKQANIFLDKREDGWVSVALTAGFGVSVFSYDAKKDSWQSRASKEIAGLVLGQSYNVRIEVDGVRVKVHLDGVTVAEASFTERKDGLTGPWGLGAQAGTAVRWSNVKMP